MLVSYREDHNGNKNYQLELYQKESNNNYSLSRTINLQDGSETNKIDDILMVTFSDLDNSGSVDLVFLYKSENKYYLKALPNSFVPE